MMIQDNKKDAKKPTADSCGRFALIQLARSNGSVGSKFAQACRDAEFSKSCHGAGQLNRL